MKVEVAIAELKGVRVAIAFPPPAWVAPGVGDVLLERLKPHFPTLPLMLAAPAHRRGGEARVHAAFQARQLAEGCDFASLARWSVDLGLPPEMPGTAPPF